MPAYTKTVWVNGTTPAINATNLNKIEQGIADAVRKDGSEAMSAQLVTIAGTVTTPAIAPTGDSNTGIFFPAADTIAFGEGGAEAMRITSTGNVGVGDFASNPPPAQFSVSSLTGGVVGVTTKRGSGTNASPISMSYGFYGYLDGEKARITATERSGNTNASDLNFQVKDSSDVLQSRLYISTAGNVGIGTTSPDVFSRGYSGTILGISSSGQSAIELNSGTGNKAFIDIGVAGTRQGYLTGSSTEIELGSATTIPLYLITNNNIRATITSAGNVGIGTTSPSYTLDANGIVRAKNAFYIGRSTDSAVIGSVKEGTSNGLKIQAEAGGTDSTITFATNGGDRAIITSAGNFGIGTTSPSAKLDVRSSGEIARFCGTNTSNTYITFSDGTTQFGDIGYDGRDTNALSIFNGQSGPLIFGAVSERMRITSAGNVGIGTTSPTPNASRNTLSINGAQGGVLELFTAGTLGYQLYPSSSTNPELINYNVTNNSGTHIFSVNGTERMRLTSAGHLGVGTASPNTTFSWDRAIGISGTNSSAIELMTGSTLRALMATSATQTNLGTISNIPLNFYQNNGEKARIDTNGYFLIGYTSSNGAYPLQVNGQIFATSSTIATSDGRYKKDVVSLDGALDIVKALNPVQFSWKDHPVHKFNTDVPTVGFIAQEVEQALANKSYLTSIIKKSECSWETETGEFVEREVTRDVEKQVMREVEREVTETIDNEEVTRTVTEEITETVIEQVTEIVTEPVKETHTEEFLGIAESNLIAILTKAVKELTAKVEALEARI